MIPGAKGDREREKTESERERGDREIERDELSWKRFRRC